MAKEKKIRRPILEGKKALVVGIANEDSIAYGCARAFHELGAEVADAQLANRVAYAETLGQGLGAGESSRNAAARAEIDALLDEGVARIG